MSDLNQGLVLTEKAVKSHCKRLQKEMSKLGQQLTLSQSQNLFARTLGFTHFHVLKKTLLENSTLSNSTLSPKQEYSQEKNLNNSFEEIQNELLTMIKEMESTTDFIWLDDAGLIQYLPLGVKLKKNNEGFVKKQIFAPQIAQEKFQKIIHFFLSNQTIFNYHLNGQINIEDVPSSWDHLLLSWEMPFSQQNNRVKRHIHIQLHPSKNPTHIKFLISYVNWEGILHSAIPFSRKYPEIVHLLKNPKDKA